MHNKLSEDLRTCRELSKVHWVIHVNLFLWMAALGATFLRPSPEYPDMPKYVVGAGVLFAAILQHWAHYNLSKWWPGGEAVN